MAVAFGTAGTAVDSVTTTLALVAPATNNDDIIVLHMMTTDNNVVVFPNGEWTLIQAVNNTAGMRTTTAWKRAAQGDSGATFNFTVAGTTVAYGVLFTVTGASIVGSPIGTFSNSTQSANATISYTTITPNNGSSLIAALGSYNLNGTTAGSVTGTNPTLTKQYEDDDASNLVASLIGSFGLSTNSSATGARTQASGAVAALNNGFMVEFLAPSNENVLGQGGSDAPDGNVTYGRLSRVRGLPPFARDTFSG